MSETEWGVAKHHTEPSLVLCDDLEGWDGAEGGSGLKGYIYTHVCVYNYMCVHICIIMICMYIYV